MGCYPEGPLQASGVVPCVPHEVQQNQVQDPAFDLRQSPVLPMSLQTGFRAALQRIQGYW